MVKSFSLLKLIVLLVLILCIAILTFVSILGENSKAENSVKTFFTAIGEQNYNDILQISSKDLIRDKFSSLEACYNDSFLIELTFLDHFNLMDKSVYQIKIKKKQSWLPFHENNKLLISLDLSEKKIRSIGDFFQPTEKENYIEDVIEVIRENGDWKINRFIMDHPDIRKKYSYYKTKLDLNRYIEKTDSGFIVKDAKIDLKKTSDVNKKLFKFSLFKINTLMNIEKKKEDEGPLKWLN